MRLRGRDYRIVHGDAREDEREERTYSESRVESTIYIFIELTHACVHMH